LIDTSEPTSPLIDVPFGQILPMAGRSLRVFALATEAVLTSDLRQGVSSILDVAERPLAE
ncbi:hypothetical protein ABTD27_19765, partial [Acinetobacter baumannii]